MIRYHILIFHDFCSIIGDLHFIPCCRFYIQIFVLLSFRAVARNPAAWINTSMIRPLTMVQTGFSFKEAPSRNEREQPMSTIVWQRLISLSNETAPSAKNRPIQNRGERGSAAALLAPQSALALNPPPPPAAADFQWDLRTLWKCASDPVSQLFSFKAC